MPPSHPLFHQPQHHLKQQHVTNRFLFPPHGIFCFFFSFKKKLGIIFQRTPTHPLLMGSIMPSDRNVQLLHTTTSPPPRSVQTCGIPQTADRTGEWAALQLHPALFFSFLHLQLKHWIRLCKITGPNTLVEKSIDDVPSYKRWCRSLI